jgi:rhodanese-related sulfurtransferase
MVIEEVGVVELEVAMAHGRLVVDVREHDEYTTAHVPGAVLLPMGSVPERLDVFATPEPALVICRTGARSMRVCQFLAEHDIAAVNVAGGTVAWINSGRSVVTGSQPL